MKDEGRRKQAMIMGMGWFLILVVYAYADIVDRLRAVVNGELITQSDINEQAAVQAVSRAIPPNLSQVEVDRLILSQLIKQKLLLQEMNHNHPPAVTAKEVDREIDALRSLYASPQEFADALVANHLGMERLRALIEVRLRVLKFVREHFRLRVTVTDKQIADYYHNTFVPEAKKSGAKNIPTLAQVAPEIREILTERSINEGLDLFLRERERAANIKIL